MKFDFTYSEEITSTPDPVYAGKVYGDPLPPLKHPANLTYPQMMLLLKQLWESLHPEISFVPFGGSQKYDPERGHIVYALDNRKPAADNSKKRIREITDAIDVESKKVMIFTQTFNNLISFTAIHKDPIIAEELIEAFEDFIIEVTPILLRNGAQSVHYARRTHDEHKQRYGEDVAARVIIYDIQLQKVLIAEISALEEISVRAQNYVQFILDNTDQATPNITTIIYDNYATPNS